MAGGGLLLGTAGECGQFMGEALCVSICNACATACAMLHAAVWPRRTLLQLAPLAATLQGGTTPPRFSPTHPPSDGDVRECQSQKRSKVSSWSKDIDCASGAVP